MLAGRKKYFTNSDVKRVCVPRYNQLSVRTVYDQICMRPEIVKYLPDIKPEADKFIDREFFFNVVNTCDTDFFPRQIKKLEEEQKRVAM